MPFISGGGGGVVSPPVSFHGTNPATVPLTVEGATAQATDILRVEDENAAQVLTVQSDGSVVLDGPGVLGTPTLLTINGAAGYGKAAFKDMVHVVNSDGDQVVTVDSGGDFFVWLDGAGAAFVVSHTGPGTGPILEIDQNQRIGFYGHATTALQTGVAVTAAGIHAALVNLGLITA